MNDDSSDALDQLLSDWAASRVADEEHTRRLSNEILAAAREQTDVGRNKSSQFRHEPTVTPLPERRRALFRPTSTSTADIDWGEKLMIGGGGLLLLLILAGCLLWYNLTTVPPGALPRARPIAGPTDSTQPTTDVASAPPAAASLGASVLAAKRQLLAETNAIFDDQLAWIADGEREVSLEVRDQAAQDNGEFMLVRVVVAQRTSPDLPWSTIWQTDVISRSESLVEVTPQQLNGSSLALWTYPMSDGEVAVDMDLALAQDTQMRSSSSTVLQTGQPTSVGCSTEDGVEHCVFQTVMPLTPSQI
jgi:hypothetical protein